MDKWGDRIFRIRGAILGCLALYGLLHAQPSWEGFWSGLGLALGGQALRVWAIGYSGEPTRGEQLEAPVLVTAGPYSYVRNPLYVGNLLNCLGVLTAAFYPWDILRMVALFGLAAVLYVFLGRHEEKFLAERFGTQYEDYQRRVPAWLPNGFGYARSRGEFRAERVLRFERTTLMWWCLVWLVLAAKGWY